MRQVPSVTRSPASYLCRCPESACLPKLEASASNGSGQTRFVVVRIRSSSVPLRAGCNRRQRRLQPTVSSTLSRAFTPPESALVWIPQRRRKVASGCHPGLRGCDGAGDLAVASTGCSPGCRKSQQAIQRREQPGGGNIFEHFDRVRSERISERRPSSGGWYGLVRSRPAFGRKRPGGFGAPSRDGSSVTAARFMASRRVPALHASSNMVSIQR